MPYFDIYQTVRKTIYFVVFYVHFNTFYQICRIPYYMNAICTAFTLFWVLYRRPDDGQLAETCRQDKNKNIFLCLTKTRNYYVAYFIFIVPCIVIFYGISIIGSWLFHRILCCLLTLRNAYRPTIRFTAVSITPTTLRTSSVTDVKNNLRNRQRR